MEFLGELLIDLLNNNVLMVALLSWFVAQVIKTIIYTVMERKFTISRLWGDGGMPSGHSATVCSAASMCAWAYGLWSPEFGVAFVLAIIVMHDASGVRREVGKQAVVTKELASILNHLFTETDEEIRTETLKELVGHTPLQVTMGAILGVIVTICFCAIGGVAYESGFANIFTPDFFQGILG